MVFKTEGIVLSFVKYSETSIIAKIYTRNFGLKSFIINGIRQPKSKVHAAFFQPLSLLDMEIYHKENRDINRIKEMKCLYPFQNLNQKIIRISIILFLCEILKNCIKEEEKNEQLFDFLKNAFMHLESMEKPADFAVYFLIRLSEFLGFFPLDNFSIRDRFFDLAEGHYVSSIVNRPYCLDETLSIQLHHLMACDLFSENKIKLPYHLRKPILHNLLIFYKLHIPNFSDIKSLPVLSEILK